QRDAEPVEQPGRVPVQRHVGEQVPALLVAQHHVRGDVQVLGKRQVLPDTRTPSLAAADGDGGTACPPTLIDPATGVTSPAMDLMSVVLPAPFSPAGATIS